MVKIRLEGTTIELKRIRRIIERNRNYKVGRKDPAKIRGGMKVE